MIIVNPNNRTPGKFAAIEPPIWCAYLASYLKTDEILDAEMEGLSIGETVDRINGRDCVLMAMGVNPSASSTPKMGVVNELRKRLKGNVSVSGLHPQGLEDTLPIVTLSPKLRGLAPSWDLIDFSKYKAHNWHCFHDLDSRWNYGVVYSSFGCPFNCYFCNIKTLYKGITFREPQDVVDEIAYLVSRGVRNLKFCDELFALNEKHVSKICDGIKDFNLNIWAYARADTITKEMLVKMKGAGFNWLAYGFDGTGKGDPYEAVRMTRDVGINVMGNFMFGLPGETMEDMLKTYRVANELQCEYINFYVALPYPGSEWYESLTDKPTDWDSFNQYSHNICADPKIVKFRDEAYHSYITNPEYLSMIKGKFGDRAVNELKEMAEWRFR